MEALEDYFIELSYDNKAERFLLPVLPESIEIKRKGKGQRFDIVGLGEINVLHKPELAEIAIESFFPASKSNLMSINEQLLRPTSRYINDINRWHKAVHPCRITIQTPNFFYTMAVSIEQFDYGEKFGSQDVYYRLAFKEYQFYAPRRYKLETQPDGSTVLKDKGPARPDERVPPTTYTLKPGDTLFMVARKQLGDDTRWREIQQLNNLTDSQLKRLPVGLVLQLPPKR